MMRFRSIVAATALAALVVPATAGAMRERRAAPEKKAGAKVQKRRAPMRVLARVGLPIAAIATTLAVGEIVEPGTLAKMFQAKAILPMLKTAVQSGVVQLSAVLAGGTGVGSHILLRGPKVTLNHEEALAKLETLYKQARDLALTNKPVQREQFDGVVLAMSSVHGVFGPFLKKMFLAPSPKLPPEIQSELSKTAGMTIGALRGALDAKAKAANEGDQSAIDPATTLRTHLAGKGMQAGLEWLADVGKVEQSVRQMIRVDQVKIKGATDLKLDEQGNPIAGSI